MLVPFSYSQVPAILPGKNKNLSKTSNAKRKGNILNSFFKLNAHSEFFNHRIGFAIVFLLNKQFNR